MKKSSSGFTIVELLIVIVVIAILAAISVVAYTGIQTRARASAIASDLKATEKAFNSYKALTGTGSWWLDTDATLSGHSSGNPQISAIISAQPEFRDFLQRIPTTEGLGTSNNWAYDNDGDTYSGCSTSVSGVNLILQGVTATDLMQALDNAIDDGDLSCGKLRHRSADNYLTYSLANQN